MDATSTTPNRFAAWVAFHRANPCVFGLFLRFAREARAARPGKIGARMVGERIRWATSIEIRRADPGPKINDHVWPYYARLAMAVDPSLDGAFDRRDERFDATDAEILAAHRSEVK